jgi:NADPH2:quinone reductase
LPEPSARGNRAAHLDERAAAAELWFMSQTVPQKMRYVEITSPGEPEVMRIAQTEVPLPKADEVLIKVHAAGVNRPDVQQRKGLYPPPPGASPILGLEAAGEIVARGGSVTTLEIGARVTALCNGGAYAEYVAVPAAQCLPWPAGFDAIRAAALPENYFTVWANVFDIAGLKPEESLLVHGGTSGIGTTAIQLARAQGSAVYSTAGSDEKCRFIEGLGAVAINYKQADFAAEIARMTEKTGVDVVLDMVGASYAMRNIASLAPRGRLVLIGLMQGAKVAEFNLTPIMVKRLVVTGSTLRPRTTAEKAAIAGALRTHVWPQLAAGKLGPVIHRVFDLEQVAEAHTLMESSAHIGKIMLRVA